MAFIIRDPIGKGKTILDENLKVEERIKLVEQLTEKWTVVCLSQSQIWEQERVKNYFDTLANYVLKADFKKEDEEQNDEKDY